MNRAIVQFWNRGRLYTITQGDDGQRRLMDDGGQFVAFASCVKDAQTTLARCRDTWPFKRPTIGTGWSKRGRA